MKPVFASDETIEQAAALLRTGGTVAFPTETVYGLGASVWNARAVARIFEIKNRPQFDPLIVHIADLDSLKKICVKVSPLAKKLMEKFWPGPLTLILPKHESVPEIVTSGLSTVAVRMPSHPAALQLILKTGTPIAAPSANPFGYLSPTTAEHVSEQLRGKVDFILDAGPCTLGVESTILDLSGAELLLLRPGGIPAEEIEKILGRHVLSREGQSEKTPTAPGQLACHYSPRTPIKLITSESWGPEEKKGLLAFRCAREKNIFLVTEILSPSGDLKEAAANLFACLHRLDKSGVDIIYAEAVPETGLGRAIMDRLRRASAAPA